VTHVFDLKADTSGMQHTMQHTLQHTPQHTLGVTHIFDLKADTSGNVVYVFALTANT